jgi:hypothetical protein
LEISSPELRSSLSLSRTPSSTTTDANQQRHTLRLSSPSLLASCGGQYTFLSPHRTIETVAASRLTGTVDGGGGANARAATVAPARTLWCGDFVSNVGCFGWSDGTLQVYGGMEGAPFLMVRGPMGALLIAFFMCCAILYCIVLCCCIILYCVVLYCIVLYCIVVSIFIFILIFIVSFLFVAMQSSLMPSAPSKAT